MGRPLLFTPSFATLSLIPENAEPMAQDDDKGTTAALAAAGDRLRTEFEDSPSEEVERVLRDSYQHVADEATVESFLPLLAERRARQALRGSH
jgi:hypothetical protein